MFSVIIPTIWSPSIESIDKLISKLSISDMIFEIVLINNNPTKFSERYNKNQKVREYKFDNIYVNQSWNFGVEKSNSKYICLMNDDIDFNTNVFEFIHKSLISDVKLIGVSKSSYNIEEDRNYFLEKVEIRNRGWGCLIFLKKEDYKQIPDDLKIHFGDDYLIKQLKGFVWRIEGLKIISEISTSVNSNPEFVNIIQQDNFNSIKYELPWSNDY
jgi:hypothetical protein